MSRTSLTISYIAIITLGILGVWLGSTAVDSEDIRRWLGLAVLVGATLGLAQIYHRDLRLSDREFNDIWQRIRARGKFRFVVMQVLFSQAVWFPVLFSYAYTLFKTRTWNALPLPEWWWFVLATISGSYSLFWSLRWWQRQERRSHASMS